MGTWIAEHLIATAISVLGGLLAAFLAKKTGAIMDAIEAKTNIDIDDKLEVRIQQIIRKVVMAISQTFVSGLKEKGKFTEAKKKEALGKAAKDAGELIMSELGITRTEDQVKLAIESELGEQKEILKVVSARS